MPTTKPVVSVQQIADPLASLVRDVLVAVIAGVVVAKVMGSGKRRRRR